MNQCDSLFCPDSFTLWLSALHVLYVSLFHSVKVTQYKIWCFWKWRIQCFKAFCCMILRDVCSVMDRVNLGGGNIKLIKMSAGSLWNHEVVLERNTFFPSHTCLATTYLQQVLQPYLVHECLWSLWNFLCFSNSMLFINIKQWYATNTSKRKKYFFSPNPITCTYSDFTSSLAWNFKFSVKSLLFWAQSNLWASCEMFLLVLCFPKSYHSFSVKD